METERRGAISWMKTDNRGRLGWRAETEKREQGIAGRKKMAYGWEGGEGTVRNPKEA